MTADRQPVRVEWEESSWTGLYSVTLTFVSRMRAGIIAIINQRLAGWTDDNRRGDVTGLIYLLGDRSW